VFDQNEMQKFINDLILPKLILYTRDIVINPQQQDLESLLKVFQWREFIDDDLFSNLLQTEFFGKWLEILWIWVVSENARLDEITLWYQHWKNLFAKYELGGLNACKEGFKTGLDMMNQGVSAQRPKQFVKTIGKAVGGERQVKADEITFQGYVESLCAESNVIFIPTLKKHVTGKDIYKMGKISVYIDDDVLYVLKDGSYRYMDVEEAIELSK
jgi:tuftelin-interacting protein 11